MKPLPPHKIVFSCLLWAILSLSAFVEAKSQDRTSLQFHHLTPDEGLSQSSVYSILQDSEGYMWFATQDGLNKYDGYDFTVYSFDPDDPYSLSLNEVRALYEDSKGNLWVGTLGRGLNLYDRDRDRFIRFTGDINRSQQTLSDNSIWAVYEDSRGNFWVGTSWGLNLMKREGEKNGDYLSKITHYTHGKEDPQSISSNNVTAVFEDSRQNLWVGTEEGLNILDRDTGTFKRYLHDSRQPRSIGADHITEIYEDETGRLWIGTLGGGLNYYDYENDCFYRYTHDAQAHGSIVENAVHVIQEDSEGRLWVGTSNQGLSLFDRAEERFHNYQYDEAVPHSLNSNAINSIYKSKDNTMWVGTFTGGVNFVDEQNKKIEHYQNNPYSNSSLSSNSVRSFIETPSGEFLVGTDGGGLNFFDRDEGKFTDLRHAPDNSNSMPSDAVLSMEEHREEGKVWLGMYNGGISSFDIASREFRHYRHEPGDERSLSSNDVFRLYKDGEDRLWVGTNGGGINVLEPGSEKFIRYRENSEDSTSIDNNDIRSFYEDSNGDLWIGTYGGRLTKFEEEREEFTFYDINTGNLYSSVIHSIHEGPGNNLWLGTRGGGLKFFDRETHEVTTYSKKEGLQSNIVNGILEDNHGHLWISTNGGISKFDPESEDVINFGVEDGLQSLEFNAGAYYRDREGYMYFGGIKGFNRFHPDSVRLNTDVAPVVLTGFQLFNRPVPIGEDSPLKKHISQTDRLVLSHDETVITFNYAALEYSPLKGTHFAYKLAGFDDEWHYVGNDRSATYTNLDPGEYELMLKAANSDGVWGEETSALTLAITPPFWRTTWFYLISVLFFVSVIYGGYRYRVRSIREQNRRLGRIIAKRTSELDEKNSELAGKNEHLEELLQELKETRGELVKKAHKAGMADLATGILHNVGNILNSVNTSASLIEDTLLNSKLKRFSQANTILRKHIDRIDEFIANNPKGKELMHYYLKLEAPLNEERKKVLKQSKRLNEKIKLINDVISAQQSYAGAQMDAGQLSFAEMIEEALALQAGSIDRYDLTVHKELEPVDPIIAQHSKLVHVLVNLVKNAREALADVPPEQREITIKTWQDSENVHLSISDNGVGIRKEHLNKIFTHGFTTKKDGHGFGLHSSANYVSEMGGKIAVQSDGEGSGTSFTLTFPRLSQTGSTDVSQESTKKEEKDYSS